MMQERRGSRRVRAYRPLRLSDARSPRVIETLTKDLAVGGLRAISTTVFPVSTEIRLELVLSEGHEPLTVKGRAVWLHTIPESEQFQEAAQGGSQGR